MSQRRIASTARRRLTLATGAWLAGCAAPPRPSDLDDAERGEHLWPAPPERPRFAWETDLRTAADLFEDSEAARTRRLLAGEVVPRDAAFEKPAAVAARGGRIYVADSVRRRLVVFDVPRRKVFVMGLRAPGTLVKPAAIALDGQGRVYVADTTLRKVLVYDGLGLHLHDIASPALVHRPTGVAVDAAGQQVYVIDRGDNDNDRHRVLVFDPKGRVQREIGTRGSGPGSFNIPVQGAVAPDDTLWVLDAGNFRLQAFDREGRFLRAFGQVGNGLGQFARPRGLACDAQGRIYVSDGAFGNVQVFDPRGRLLLSLGRFGRTDRPGRYGLAHGVAVDETGRVYIVDQFFNKVEVLRPVGDDEAARLVQAAAMKR